MPEQRLGTYGTLAPGKPNHHQMDGLSSQWFAGHVHGTLIEDGWGAAMGYPALVLDPDRAAIEVQVFESADLQAHWHRLDEFEGAGYARVHATIHTTHGPTDGFVYVLGVPVNCDADHP